MLKRRKSTAAVRDRRGQDGLVAVVARPSPSLGSPQKTEDEPQPAISNPQNALQLRLFQCLPKISEILVLQVMETMVMKPE
jgi:hypothetical protein